jgi:hypothetical protein
MDEEREFIRLTPPRRLRANMCDTQAVQVMPPFGIHTSTLSPTMSYNIVVFACVPY